MSGISCPRCGSEAFNRYGRTKNGKQRFICLVCDRQFINGETNRSIGPRPNCSVCGKPMHVYMRAKDIIRFRCAAYPECRTYATESKEN